MKNIPLFLSLRILPLVLNLFTALALIGIFAQPAKAQTETVLYSFCPGGGWCSDGFLPDSLIADSAGNLYGTTLAGGTGVGGVAFRLTAASEYSIVYSFTHANENGWKPASITLDSQGNLYGTTYEGGTHSVHVYGGDGTAFKITPGGTETILYNFGVDSTDGIRPFAGLVEANGNLYGTTSIGGLHSSGTIFRITPEGVETILHNFGSSRSDGAGPVGSLVMDSKGNLYGMTDAGGTNNQGTVFELTTLGKYQILHNFGAAHDASEPRASLILDGQGNLYGATYVGGANETGAVFRLSPGTSGSWTETVLYSFPPENKGNCRNPYSNVVLDQAGNLYGTTITGGALDLGCVYEVSPSGALTILHSFGTRGDGADPTGNILFSQGNLYGTTSAGGAYGGGSVFEISF